MKRALVLLALMVPTLAAQEPPKPGPEHDLLKKQVGTWDTVMKADGKEFKGTVVYKLELGDLWLVGSMDSDLGGQRFYGSSFIADQRGDLVAAFGREDEGVLHATFDLDFLATHRAAWGFFRDRRTDLYGLLTQGRPA